MICEAEVRPISIISKANEMVLDALEGHMNKSF